MADPRVERFLERFSLPPREAVLADVAKYDGVTLEDHARDLAACCRTVAKLLADRPDREAILTQRDLPHPSYAAIVGRLRTERPAST